MAKDKLSYAELEEENAKLKKQLEVLQFDILNNGQIQNREEYLINIFNSMGDPVFVKDNESRILLANNAFCELFGLQRKEILGKTLAEHVPSNERDNFLKIDRQVLSDGIENIQEESMTVDGDKTKTISTRKTRFIDSKGNIFLVGVIRDLSERKMAEDALKTSESKFRQLNEKKDKILSIIAHDLKSPISTILSFSDFMHEEIIKTGNKEFESYCSSINKSAKNAHILLDNLLNWARSNTGQIQFEPKKTDLNQRIKNQIDINKSNAAIKNITLEYQPISNIEIYTDSEMLSVVLRNLIHNAIKFTRNGGTIKITQAIRANNVEITISDNGVGMDDKLIKNLFSSETNTSTYGTAQEKGSGIGLSLCKEFVYKMGGKIWVKSELGIGSDFTFSVPKFTSIT